MNVKKMLKKAQKRWMNKRFRNFTLKIVGVFGIVHWFLHTQWFGSDFASVGTWMIIVYLVLFTFGAYDKDLKLKV